MRRRQLFRAGGALALGTLCAPAHAQSSQYELRELRAPGNRRVGDRFTLLTPKHDAGARFPLLVLLHGLGETGDLRMGAHAWVERYGLGTAYDRLRTAPVAMLDPKGRHWRAERLAEVNAELRRRPFGGLVIACPYTPNVYKAPDRGKLLDDYAAWLTEVVMPKARAEASVKDGAESTHLDGCSLGGYLSIEVLLRKPESFGGWGSVQGAFGAHRVPGYASALAALQPRKAILIETSSQDDFREVNTDLSRKLRAAGVAHDFLMPPGPHNQPFLRDSGTLEMLLWHERKMA